MSPQPPEATAAAGADGAAPLLPTISRVLPVLEAAVFLASLLFALLFWMRLPGELPTDADYNALFAAMRQEGRPGDAFTVLPFWAQRARTYIHGIPFIGYPALAGEPDVERYARLWVVAQPSLPRSDAADSLRELDQKLQPVGEKRHFGPLVLALYETRPERVTLYDFRMHAREAQATAGTPRVDWHEFDYLPRSCIQVPSGGQQTTLVYNGVELAHGIRGGFGVLGNADSARLVFSVDGREAPPVDLVAGQRGWQHFELPVPESGVAPGGHTVNVAITGRNVCFDAVAF